VGDKLVLFSYWRSSSSYRVRIVLHLKGLNFEYRPVHLVKNGGEQNSADYLSRNPKGEVPFLLHHSFGLSQSVAILHYLEENWPNPRMLPGSIEDRARCLEIVEVINSGVQPLHNLGVLKNLELMAGFDEAKKKLWMQTYIKKGCVALESLLTRSAKKFCIGDEVSWADACLVPHVYSAKRFEVDLSSFPKILEINQHCLALSAFERAIPENQIDAGM